MNYISYNFTKEAVVIKRILRKTEKKGGIKTVCVKKWEKKRNCLILFIHILKGFNVADNFKPEAKFTVCKQ